MADGPPALSRREVKLPDGRRLIFYDFPEPAAPRVEAPAPAPPPAPPPAPRQEP